MEEKLKANPVEAYPCRRASTAVLAMAACDKTFYLNVHHMLKLFAALPLSTAAAERCFCTLRRLKTYLRNSTSESRLNGLALMNVHRQIHITPDRVTDILLAARNVACNLRCSKVSLSNW